MAFGGEAGETYNAEACAKCHEGIGEGDNFDLDDVQTEVTALIGRSRRCSFRRTCSSIPRKGFLPPDREVLSRSEPGDSAGALWNYFMAKEDRSEGVHNREYITSLLQSAIEFMQPAPGSPAVATTGENRKSAR